MIYVVDDDEIMAGCIARACEGVDTVRIFSNAIEVVQNLDDRSMPRLIFLDILLDGPDGFTLLNELASYADTGRVPVVVVSSLDFDGRDLGAYGVVGILDKSTMTPDDIRYYAEAYCG